MTGIQNNGALSPKPRSNSLGDWELIHDQNRLSFQSKQYAVFAAEAHRDLALRLQASSPTRFRYFPINWGKYPDGTDDITIGGFNPTNHVASSHVLFFASFHNNDVTLSQFSVLIVLLQSFIESLTVVLPFYPVGTNERVTLEGKVATANTYSTLLSSLPNIGRPSRLMIYDIHALQERFYFHSSALPSLHSSVPLLIERLKGSDVSVIAFPDDGATKRFGGYFAKLGFDIVTCGKVREGDKRRVHITDGNPTGKSVVIVDDLVQSGGTLHECAIALKLAGAINVSAFVAHAVFPNDSWRKFCTKDNGDCAVFQKFWITNSIPTVTNQLPLDSCFEVLDLLPLIRKDLDSIFK